MIRLLKLKFTDNYSFKQISREKKLLNLIVDLVYSLVYPVLILKNLIDWNTLEKAYIL